MTIIRILLGLINAILKVFVQVLLEGFGLVAKALSVAGLTALLAILLALGAGALVRAHRRRS